MNEVSVGFSIDLTDEEDTHYSSVSDILRHSLLLSELGIAAYSEHLMHLLPYTIKDTTDIASHILSSDISNVTISMYVRKVLCNTQLDDILQTVHEGLYIATDEDTRLNIPEVEWDAVANTLAVFAVAYLCNVYNRIFRALHMLLGDIAIDAIVEEIDIECVGDGVHKLRVKSTYTNHACLGTRP